MKPSTTILSLAAFLAAAVPARASSWEVLYSFPPQSYPQSTLVQGSDGALYGTTQRGGLSGYGSVFRVTTNGVLTNLVSFGYADGAYPYSGLIFGRDGALYGTAQNGSTNDYGSVFRVTTNGDFTTLACFTQGNGAYPKGTLLQGEDGAFYGTTYGGGVNGVGTVFRVATNGELAVLVSFAVTNGAHPYAGLTRGNDGAFYGTTTDGGVNPTNYNFNYGSVFRVTTNGQLTSLALFGGYGAAYPRGNLLLANDGLLYGTTPGTIFRIATNGVPQTLASFTGDERGVDSEAGLLQCFDGAFYGTAAQGSGSGDGTVFRVTTNGVLSGLVEFR